MEDMEKVQFATSLSVEEFGECLGEPSQCDVPKSSLPLLPLQDGSTNVEHGEKNKIAAATNDQATKQPNTNPVSKPPLPPQAATPIEEGTKLASGGAEGKKRLTSKAWEFFTKVKVDGVWKAKCNRCSNLLSYKVKNGTSHLNDHYRNYCRKMQHKDIKQMLLRGQAKADGTMMVGTYSFDQEASRKELVKMIIVHEYPICMVEHDGFRSYSASLQPLFKIPSRNTIKSDILKLYEEKRTSLMRELDSLDSRISVTTDMWTAEHQKKGYMAITAHYIDSSWILQKRLLRYVLN